MFGVGLFEAALLTGMLLFVFRRPIARRFPKFGRAAMTVLYIVLGLVVLYDLIALLRNASA